MGNPSRASEFPNDNEEISSGARWSSEHVTGAVEAQLPLELTSSASHTPVVSEPFVLFFCDDEQALEGPVELALGAHGPVLVASEARLELEAPPALRRFERALEQALMGRAATRAAALVPRLLRFQPLPVDALAEDLHRSLRDSGYLDEAGRYSPRFQERWGAWSAVLCGSSDDLSACGATTLDGFGAELLTALLGVPKGRAEELRRELRKAGIAAFGVLEAA